MAFDLTSWAIKHQVSAVALAELSAAFGHIPELGTEVNTSDREAVVQAKVRLLGKLRGYELHRNNVGAIKDERGIPVRYGLANDSSALNKAVKSSDLVGFKSEIWIHPETFAPTKIARFASIECKHGGWPGYNPENPHERAQQRWHEYVVANGGISAFSTGELPE